MQYNKQIIFRFQILQVVCSITSRSLFSDFRFSDFRFCRWCGVQHKNSIMCKLTSRMFCKLHQSCIFFCKKNLDKTPLHRRVRFQISRMAMWENLRLLGVGEICFQISDFRIARPDFRIAIKMLGKGECAFPLTLNLKSACQIQIPRDLGRGTFP